jgi:amino acid transporter
MNAPSQPVKTPQERNQETWKRHRQEVFRQITLPIMIAAGILLLISGLVALGSIAEIKRWADISIIWLIIPALLLTFLAMLALAGMVYLIVRLIVVLPFLSYRVLVKFRALQVAIRNASDRAVAPVLKIAGIKASVQTAFHRQTKVKTTTSNQPVSDR